MKKTLHLAWLYAKINIDNSNCQFCHAVARIGFAAPSSINFIRAAPDIHMHKTLGFPRGIPPARSYDVNNIYWH